MTRPRRSGATAGETVVVLAVLFLIVFGILVGGVGVFRYQQVACLSREGARWASVRGGQCYKETDQAPPTAAQIAERAVHPLAVGMNPAAVTVQVEWIDRGTNTTTSWDAAPKDVWSVTPSGEVVTNAVRVTVSYQWAPGVGWQSMTMTSVTETPLSN